MTKIDFVKKKSGVPADRIITREIVDELIISYPYAIRIADYILDRFGRSWWTARGTLAVTEVLNRGDAVELWADGIRYDGFLPSAPAMSFTIDQGRVEHLWNITALFLKDE